MTTFDFLWKMLDEHGVVERYKGDAFDLWNTLTLDQQRAIMTDYYARFSATSSDQHRCNIGPITRVKGQITHFQSLT